MCEEEIKEVTDSVFKYILPKSWSKERKENDPITAERVVEAIKAGKDVEIKNAVITDPFILKSVNVEGEVTIQRTKIRGPIDWSYATFKRVLNLENSIFEFETDATFTAVTAEKDIFLDEATFCGIAVFADITVMGAFYSRSTTFKKDVIFSDGIVKKGIAFSKSTFVGNAYFGRARIRSAADFSGAEFKKQANFNGAQIDGDAYFNPYLFNIYVEFEDDLNNGIISEKLEKIFKAEGFSISQNAFVTKDKCDSWVITDGEKNHIVKKENGKLNIYNVSTTFVGEASFVSARIGGNAEFTEAVFKQEAIFNRVQIKGAAFFNPATFEGDADFISALIGGTADFNGAEFKQQAYFNSAQIERESHFDGTIFDNDVSFKDTTLKTVFWGEPNVQFHENIDLRGCTYDRFQPIPFWEQLMEHLGPYDPQPFTQLEETFRRAGKVRLANDVYYKRKCREYTENIAIRKPIAWDAWLHSALRKHGSWRALSALRKQVAWLFDRFHWMLTGYGVRLYRLLWAIVPILLFGTYIFQLEGAVTPELHSALPWSEAFWVSLNTFLPAIEIPSGADWKPSSQIIPYLGIKFTTFATLLVLAGWILVPLGVAGDVISGMLKRPK